MFRNRLIIIRELSVALIPGGEIMKKDKLIMNRGETNGVNGREGGMEVGIKESVKKLNKCWEEDGHNLEKNEINRVKTR